MEDKTMIVQHLKMALRHTRAGSGLDDLRLSDDEKTVFMTFVNGGSYRINVAADSGIALIKDVLSYL